MPQQALKMRHGGRILADALVAQGVTMAFGVPGESFLPLLDGLHDVRDKLAFISCRQEGGAAYMADAYGKLTGRPGVLMVTRGPGATNGAVGVHTAYQDSTPLLVLIGQVGNEMAEREAFQEIDYRRMYGPLAKWVAQIDRIERIPEFISRAFHTAMAGRPGPVVLALPEDVLFAESAVADVGRHRVAQPAPTAQAMQQLVDMLQAAQQPLVILGGSGWTREARKRLQGWAEANGLPVCTSFRRQDLMDAGSHAYVGDMGIAINPRLAERIRQSDVLLVVGARLGEMATQGYTLLDIPQPRQRLVHVQAGAEELGKVYLPELAINAGYPEFVEALVSTPLRAHPRWAAQTAAARADYTEWGRPRPMPGPVQYGEIVRWLSDHLPDDAVITTGAGNFTGWVHRHFACTGSRTQLAPTNGSMGYSFCSALAAKLTAPERTVVAVCGDGDFLMNGQEIATAVQHGAAFVAIVVNNGIYGSIRMHQERHYPGRVIGTALHNPDFAAYARAFGAHGETVQRTEDFAAAYERARSAGKPALVELRIDPEAIIPSSAT
ncbi:MAG: thiamine pyrophosphate-binding protein [Bordetella sp.]|nr:thiamine pyrophosphate-binding protein [Bordetella sp.]